MVLGFEVLLIGPRLISWYDFKHFPYITLRSTLPSHLDIKAQQTTPQVGEAYFIQLCDMWYHPVGSQFIKVHIFSGKITHVICSDPLIILLTVTEPILN